MYVNVEALRRFAYSDDKYNVFKNQKEINSELFKLASTLIEHFENSNVEKTSNWLIQENNWLQNEDGSLCTNSVYQYERGDIVASVDLGVNNLGTEIRYPHPCVTLYDGGDWLLVAPITGVRLDENNKPIIYAPFEIYTDSTKKIPKNSKDFIFRKPSVIQLDQIKRISKSRIINKKRYKLRNELLNQIDNVVLQYFIPLKFKLINELKTIINQTKEENNKLKKDLEHKENTIKTLKTMLIKFDSNKKIVDK